MITKSQLKKRHRRVSVRLNNPKLKPEELAKILALLRTYDIDEDYDQQYKVDWLMLYNSKFRSQVLNIIKTKKR